MPKAHFLVGGVIGIFVCTGLAFAFIAPQYRDVLEYDEEDESLTYESEVEKNNADTPFEASDRIEDEDEENDGTQNVETSTVPTTQTVTHTQPTTKPTTVQTETQQTNTTPSTNTTPPTPVPTTPPKDGYTLADIANHNTKESCWSAIDGSVYNLTAFASRHPGGEKNILKICGKDGTALFEKQHGGESKPASRLASLYVGKLIQ